LQKRQNLSFNQKVTFFCAPGTMKILQKQMFQRL
jgi:hypothetical protein